MKTLKRNRVYQIQETSEVISTSRMSYASVKAYVLLQSVKKDVARCKVLFVLEQPKSEKLVANKWVYIPTANLVEPDLYPAYAKHPRQWVKYAKQPVLSSAIEILSSLSPTMSTEVTAHLVTGKVRPGDIKVGQNWATDKDRVLVEKQWSDKFIVKDRYGDRQKVTPEELSDLLNSKKFKLKKSFDKNALLKQIGTLLLPFMGAFAVKSLLGVLKGLIK